MSELSEGPPNIYVFLMHMHSRTLIFVLRFYATVHDIRPSGRRILIFQPAPLTVSSFIVLTTAHDLELGLTLIAQHRVRCW